ncbi:DUF6248 family natural product biosynthesis protein [Streptomyces sp. NPDC046942]|uniref:DUF6248 family natural product biosynthesis protein n=1 Tax=Streptomyces sp. NPDC046942 TaxID=3155137 RepID=UPI0034113152
MTTWLRYVGASIMGILDPVPSAVPSLMSEEEASWVRANAWTKGLRRIEEAYPHGFHRWCSCERGTCHPCATGHHDQCASADSPRIDEDAGTVTDRGGFVVAIIQYGPGQRPCRWVCACSHPADATQPTAGSAGQKRRVASRTRPVPPRPYVTDDQLALFTSAVPLQKSADRETR